MEHCGGGTLSQIIHEKGAFNEEDSRFMARQTLLAVRSLHSHNPPIAHRDINASNFILTLDGNETKMRNLGSARYMGADTTQIPWSKVRVFVAG